MRFIVIAILWCLLTKVSATAQESVDLFEDLRILSADSMQGREVGTVGSQMARNYITQRLTQMSVEPLNGNYHHSFELVDKQVNSPAGTNIIAVIPGFSKQYIVMSAHYDHLGIVDGQVYNGSDDNASGVAAILFVADSLRKLELNHSFIILFPDAEEKGLQGAKAFMEQFESKEDLLMNINLDMVSRSESSTLVASGGYHYQWINPYLDLWSKDADLNIIKGFDSPRSSQDWTFASDHGVFHRKQIPYLYFGVQDHPDYHQPSDDYEKTDFTFYRNVAEFILNVAIKIDDLDLKSITSKSRK